MWPMSCGFLYLYCLDFIGKCLRELWIYFLGGEIGLGKQRPFVWYIATLVLVLVIWREEQLHM
jgi:hypothetical protein